ncbi:UNVERIFIED_CONTAM: hypothetical protein Sradi_6804900 [Sesamum radiatum]|uniref:Uncharacterized protein n=1 Tax=Sesamum radiatum TaxID=300843 RepID=A0AAW2JTQ8_SESRA
MARIQEPAAFNAANASHIGLSLSQLILSSNSNTLDTIFSHCQQFGRRLARFRSLWARRCTSGKEIWFTNSPAEMEEALRFFRELLPSQARFMGRVDFSTRARPSCTEGCGRGTGASGWRR